MTERGGQCCRMESAQPFLLRAGLYRAAFFVQIAVTSVRYAHEGENCISEGKRLLCSRLPVCWDLSVLWSKNCGRQSGCQSCRRAKCLVQAGAGRSRVPQIFGGGGGLQLRSGLGAQCLGFGAHLGLGAQCFTSRGLWQGGGGRQPPATSKSSESWRRRIVIPPGQYFRRHQRQEF